MIFNNLKMSDISPELEFFLRLIVGRVLLKNFYFSIGANELDVIF